MNKRYSGKIAVLTAFLSAFYLPQAMANLNVNYGEPLLPLKIANEFVDTTILSGAFTDTYTFTVSEKAYISGNLTSSFDYVLGHGSLSSFSSGVALTSASLFDVTTNKTAATLTLSQIGPASNGPFVFYNDTLSFAGTVTLTAGNTYELIVNGKGGSSLTPVTTKGDYATTVAVIPEPEQWGMLLLGLPLIGWVARHKPADSVTAMLA